MSFITVDVETHHFSLLKKLPKLDKATKQKNAAMAKEEKAARVKAATKGKKGKKKEAAAAAALKGSRKLFVPRFVTFRPWKPDNISSLIVPYKRSAKTENLPTVHEDVFVPAKKPIKVVKCKKLALKALRAVLKDRGAKCDGCAEKSDFVDECEATQKEEVGKQEAEKKQKAEKAAAKKKKQDQKKADAKKKGAGKDAGDDSDDGDDDDDDEDGDDDDDDDDDNDDDDDDKPKLMMGRLSLSAKQLRDRNKNLTAEQADRIFDQNAISLRKVMDNLAVVDHKNLLVELFGRRYPFEVGERFAFATALYGSEWSEAETEKLMARVVKKELANKKKHFKKGLHAKAHTGDFSSSTITDFLDDFNAGRLKKMAELVKGTATVRPRLDVTTPAAEKAQKARKRKEREDRAKKEKDLHWKKRQERKKARQAKKNKKPETAKERAQREAKIRAQMDKEAEDLVEAVDDEDDASKEEKQAEAPKEAEDTSSTTAEAVEEASDDAELADEAMDDEAGDDEEETVLDLDDDE